MVMRIRRADIVDVSLTTDSFTIIEMNSQDGVFRRLSISKDT